MLEQRLIQSLDAQSKIKADECVCGQSEGKQTLVVFFEEPHKYILYTFLKRVTAEIQCVHQRRCAWLESRSKTKLPHMLARCSSATEMCRYESEQKHEQSEIIKMDQVKTPPGCSVRCVWRYAGTHC